MRIEDAILACRLAKPYYSRGLQSMTPIAGMTPTMAVDKYWRLYYSQEFLDSLTIDQAAAVIEHELMHLLRDHNRRRKNSAENNSFRWNIAADLEINDDISGLPDGCVTPKSMRLDEGLLAEEYLALLPESSESKPCGGGSGAGADPLEGEIEEADAPSVSSEDADALKEAIAKDVIEHAEKSEHKMAKPGEGRGVLMWAKELIQKAVAKKRKTRLSVRQRLKLCFGISDDRIKSFGRMSRKTNSSSFIRPGFISVKPLPRAVLLDCSGSMHSSEMNALTAVLSEFSASIDLWGVDGDKLQLVPATKTGIAQLRGGGDIHGDRALETLSKKYKNITVITDGHEFWGASKPKKSIVNGILVGTGKLPDWMKIS